MELLLDTHVVLWWLADDPRLTPKARSLIADPVNGPVVSAASAWEIAIKQGLGKVMLDGDFEQAVLEQGFATLAISFRHAMATLDLPLVHRDPFDRLLVAQARVEGLSLLSADPLLERYPVTVIAC